MWKNVSEIFWRLLDLTRTQERHSRQIATLEEQVKELQQTFGQFAVAYEKDRKRDREQLILQFENALLKLRLEQAAERKQLPPGE